MKIGGILTAGALVLTASALSLAQIQPGVPPANVFGSYLGGTQNGAITQIAVGKDGSIYVTGFTFSPDFPVTPGAYQTSYTSSPSWFVTKLSPDGKKIIYSTFLAGGFPIGIAVNESGEAYVAGYGDTAVVYGSQVVFVAELDTTGSKLLNSTLLSGQQPLERETTCGVGLDNDGNVYVAGSTTANDFPVTPNAIQSSNAAPQGYVNLFLTEFDPTLSQLKFST